MRDDNLPSCGFSGQVGHPFGAINDDGTVNRLLLRKQARNYALHYRKSFPGVSYRAAFRRGMELRSADVQERLRRVAVDRAYDSELAKGGVAANIARLSRAIEIHAHCVSPDYGRLADQRAELHRLIEVRDRPELREAAE